MTRRKLRVGDLWEYKTRKDPSLRWHVLITKMDTTGTWYAHTWSNNEHWQATYQNTADLQAWLDKNSTLVVQR